MDIQLCSKIVKMAMKPGFTKKLPTAIYQERERRRIQKIVNSESPRIIGLQVGEAEQAIDKIPNLSKDQRNALKMVTNDPLSGLGRALAATIAGIAAPLLLDRAGVGFGYQLLSVPVAAAGTYSLMNMIDPNKSTPRYFYPELPSEIPINKFKRLV